MLYVSIQSKIYGVPFLGYHQGNTKLLAGCEATFAREDKEKGSGFARFWTGRAVEGALFFGFFF